MRDALAERLLAQVMEWTPEDVARERPILQAMAAFKYDEYQQFSPGMRFVESLALWLGQFANNQERQIAYDFIKNRLVFLSDGELSHLVSVAYQDFIRPMLIKHTSAKLAIPDRLIAKIVKSVEFRALRRQCLFLGLSDGARIDAFRRGNADLTHEQIWHTYEFTPEKAKDMQDELKNDIEDISGESLNTSDIKFRKVFLLDDFSGSGMSCLRRKNGEDRFSGIIAKFYKQIILRCLRRKNDGDRFSGKIAKFYKQIMLKGSGLSNLIDIEDLYIGVVIYVATDKARLHLEKMLRELLNGQNIEWGIHVVQTLDGSFSLRDSSDSDFLRLTDVYYDSDVEDEHTRKGGSDVKRGFAGCSLPLVLTHNTPNNSVFLLWANPESYKIRGLFPRISRHRSEV